MTNRHLTVASAFLLLLSVGPFHASAQEGTGPEAQVRQIADEWMSAANSGDLEAFMQLMAEDAVVMFPGMDPVVGSDAIREIYRDYYSTWDLEYEYDLHEAVTAGKMLIGRATVSGTRTARSGGETTDQRFNNLWVLQKDEDGNWKFWRAIFNAGSSPSD